MLPRGLLHLPLVGIAARNHTLGQAVGGEEKPRRSGLNRLSQQRLDQRRMGLNEPLRARVAADGVRRRGDAGSAGGLPPSVERRGHGCGRELRVERQQHDALRPEGGHPPCRRFAHWMPVTHRDNHLDLTKIDESNLQRRRLCLGLFKQRRTSADRAVNLPCFRPPALRDQARQQPTHRPRRADDRRVAEQITQERLDGIERIGAAEVHENHRNAAHEPTPPGVPCTRSQSWATCSGGVWGNTPSPRLNTKGPFPSASRIRLTALP